MWFKVGDPDLDHSCWERPETMSEKRPLTQINTTFPGTEVAAETAAAMASASLVFRRINSSYANLLLMHARQLFTFADTYRGSYSMSVPQVQKYYNSTGYEDELLWAATWLYHATRDRSYLEYVTDINGQAFANWGIPTWFSWDNKHAGLQVHITCSKTYCILEMLLDLEINFTTETLILLHSSPLFFFFFNFLYWSRFCYLG